MPQGFEAYDENGVITVSITDRLTKILGTFNTTTSNGSQAVSVPTWGAVWIQLTALENTDFAALPRAYYSNGAIYWTFTDVPVNAPPARFRTTARLTYGVY